MPLHQVTIVRLWKDLDFFWKIMSVQNVQNVLEHVAGDDIANKASILASKSTRRALILLPQF